MSDISDPLSELDRRRRKARFRAWHRGMREADLVLGGFADAEVTRLDEEELGLFEALLDEPDGDIVKWITGELELPARQDNALTRRLIQSFRPFQKN